MSDELIQITPLGYEEKIKDFEDFQLKIQERILRKAYTKGGRYLMKQLKATIRGSGIKATARSEKYSDRLIDAVRGKFHRGRGVNDNSFFKVHEMGTRGAGSGTFRLRFFDVGTKERVQQRTSKLGNVFTFRVGRIQAYNFMDNTVASSSSAIETTVAQTIDEEINKYKDKLS